MQKLFLLTLFVLPASLYGADPKKDLFPAQLVQVQLLGNSFLGSAGLQHNFSRLLGCNVFFMAMPVKNTSFLTYGAALQLHPWGKRKCFFSVETGIEYLKKTTGDAIYNGVQRIHELSALTGFVQPAISLKASASFLFSLTFTRFLPLQLTDSWHPDDDTEKRVFGSFSYFAGLRLSYVLSYRLKAVQNGSLP